MSAAVLLSGAVGLIIGIAATVILVDTGERLPPPSVHQFGCEDAGHYTERCVNDEVTCYKHGESGLFCWKTP